MQTADQFLALCDPAVSAHWGCVAGTRLFYTIRLLNLSKGREERRWFYRTSLVRRFFFCSPQWLAGA